MCGVFVGNSDDFPRNIDAFRTNVDAFHSNFVHAFDTNVDACRWNLKLMRAHSLLTKVTSVELYYAKSRYVHSVRTNLLFQIAIFVPMAVIEQQVRSYNQLYYRYMTNVWCDVNGRFVVFSHGNQNST
jgi:hypothetical protein